MSGLGILNTLKLRVVLTVPVARVNMNSWMRNSGPEQLHSAVKCRASFKSGLKDVSFKQLDARLKAVGKVNYNEFMFNFTVDGKRWSSSLMAGNY